MRVIPQVGVEKKEKQNIWGKMKMVSKMLDRKTGENMLGRTKTKLGRIGIEGSLCRANFVPT